MYKGRRKGGIEGMKESRNVGGSEDKREEV